MPRLRRRHCDRYKPHRYALQDRKGARGDQACEQSSGKGDKCVIIPLGGPFNDELKITMQKFVYGTMIVVGFLKQALSFAA